MNKPRLGRPNLPNTQQDRILIQDSLQDRWLTSPIFKNVWESRTGIEASVSTIKRRLVDAGLNGRIARRKPLAQPRNVAERLRRTKEHEDWTVEMWEKVVWPEI